MIISFSGTSASGKSTIIAEIVKSNIFEDRKVIVREEDSFLIVRILKRVLGEDIFSKYKEEKFFRRKYNNIFSRTFSVLSYIFYPISVYIELLAEYIWYEKISKNTIVLADRFTYDYDVTFKEVLGISNKFVEWLYSHSPKPYLAFLVDIDLKTALKRNKNNIPGKITADESFHKNVLARYCYLAKLHKLVVIDNSDKLETAVKEAGRYIVNKKKFEKIKRVAICGLDGSGKSTITAMLARYMDELGIESKVVHFYHQNLLYKLLRLIGFYQSNEPKDVLYRKSRERAERERVGKTTFIKAFLRFFDSYIQYLFFIVIHKDKVIFFDRFFYDYLVSFEYLNIKGRSIFKKFLPAVNNRILLDSMPEISYKRKPESVKEFFNESHDIYLKMAQEQDMKIVHIDNKKPEQVLNEVINNIN